MTSVQEKVAKTFDSGESTENKTRVRALIDDIKGISIDASNIVNINNKVQGILDMIHGRVEELSQNYEDLRKEFVEICQDDDFKHWMSNDTIPKQAFDKLTEIQRTSKQIVQWSTYENIILNVLFAKMGATLMDSRSIEVERDGLKRFEQMQKANNELFLKTMDNTSKSLHNNMVSTMKRIEDKRSREMRDYIDMMIESVYKNTQMFSEIIKAINIDGPRADKLEEVNGRMEQEGLERVRKSREHLVSDDENDDVEDEQEEQDDDAKTNQDDHQEDDEQLDAEIADALSVGTEDDSEDKDKSGQPEYDPTAGV